MAHAHTQEPSSPPPTRRLLPSPRPLPWRTHQTILSPIPCAGVRGCGAHQALPGSMLPLPRSQGIRRISKSAGKPSGEGPQGHHALIPAPQERVSSRLLRSSSSPGTTPPRVPSCAGLSPPRSRGQAASLSPQQAHPTHSDGNCRVLHAHKPRPRPLRSGETDPLAASAGWTGGVTSNTSSSLHTVRHRRGRGQPPSRKDARAALGRGPGRKWLLQPQQTRALQPPGEAGARTAQTPDPQSASVRRMRLSCGVL